MTPFEYWALGQGLCHITPHGKPWPEDDSFAQIIRDMTRGRTVIEFGCGIGRLAALFDPALYRGVDICAEAIRQAQQLRPGHAFAVIDDRQVLGDVDMVFAHNVLMHIPDESLAVTLARFRSPRVIVSEVLGRKWRRSGNPPPVFNRELAEYAAGFAPGFRLAQVVSSPCPHYSGTDLSIMEFEASIS